MTKIKAVLRFLRPLGPSSEGLRSILGGLLAVSFFFCNVLGVYAQEQNFWSARRMAARKMQPPESEGIDLGQEGNMLLSQIPQAVRMDLGSAGGAAISSTPGELAKIPATKSAPQDWLAKLVTPYGWVRDVYLSPKANAPVVVHIQDAHGIEEAQRNISAMLGSLMQERRVNLVGLEGASGSFTLDPYRNYPDASITKDIADFLLIKGLIAGPEYAGLTLPQAPAFYGAEDSTLYEGNVKALKTAFKTKTALLATLATLRAAAEQEKKKTFSEGLKSFDRHFEAYKAQREKLGDYVRALVKTPGGRDARLDIPNVRLLLNALDWEENLDFKAVETERQRLVEVLVRRLSKPALQDLISRSIDYRTGRMGYGDYHRHLRQVCADNKIRLDDFGQLSSYITYVLLAEKISRNELVAELDQLEIAAQNSLAKTPDETALMNIARDLALLEKMLRHEMAMPDWLAYEKRRNEILALRDRLAALDPTVAKLPSLTVETLKPFEDFCSYAVRRNDALVANLLAKMAEKGTTTGVLVAGGFHTEGLTGLFRQKQISYVVVTPKITDVPGESDYLDILAHDPVPLEKLVAGDRIYLSHPIALADAAGETPKFIHGAQEVLQNGVRSVSVSAAEAVEPCDNVHGANDRHVDLGDGHAVDMVRRAGSVLSAFGALVGGAAARLGQLMARAAAAPGTWTRNLRDRATLAFNGGAFSSLGQMNRLLPGRIAGELAGLGLSAAEVDAARRLMATVAAVYDRMGLSTAYYHNMAHNLGVTHTLLQMLRGRPATSRDEVKAAFLAGLLHDFHLRDMETAKNLPGGLEAEVTVTLRQLSALWGVERSVPKGEEALQRFHDEAYFNKIRAEFGDALRGEFTAFLGNQTPAAVLPVVEALIRRTDFPRKNADGTDEKSPQTINAWFEAALNRLPAGVDHDTVRDLAGYLQTADLSVTNVQLTFDANVAVIDTGLAVEKPGQASEKGTFIFLINILKPHLGRLANLPLSARRHLFDVFERFANVPGAFDVPAVMGAEEKESATARWNREKEEVANILKVTESPLRRLARILSSPIPGLGRFGQVPLVSGNYETAINENPAKTLLWSAPFGENLRLLLLAYPLMMVAGAPAWALASTALMALLLTRDYHQKVFYETEDGIVRQRTATWMERLGIFSWFTAFGVGSLAVTVLMTGAFVPSFAGLGPAEILQNLPVLARGLADSVLSVGTSSFWATPLQSLRELAGASAAVLGPLVGGFTAGLLGHSGVNLARRREGRAFLTGNDSKGRGFFGNLVSLATDLMGLKPTNTIVEVGPAGKPITLADTNHITGSREPTIGYKINYDPIYDRDLLERSKAIQTWALNQENYGLIRGFSGEIDGPRSGQHSGRTWWAAVPLAAKDKIVEALKAGNLADPDVNRYLSHNVRRYLASPKGQIWVTTLHDLVSQNPLESVEQDSLGDLVAHFTETNMPLNGVHAFSLEWNPGFELDFQRNIRPETGYDEVFPKDFDFFQWRLTRHISEALHRDLPGDLQKTAGEHTVAVFLNEDKTAVERVVVGSTQFGWRFSPETNAMVLPGDESHPDGRASVEEVQHRMIQLNVRTDETGRWQTERVRGFFNDLQLANHLLNRSGRVTNDGPASEESGPLVVSTVQPLPLMVVHQMGLPVGEFVPEKFVAELMNDRELGRIFLMGTETDEGHRLYQHTAMVLRQFERYFAGSPRFQAALTKAGVDLGFFRLFMALHDIGKPEARAGRVGENEFDHTSRLIRRYFERHGLSSKQLDLALSLAGGDPIGQYLRANPPTSTEFLSARDPLFIALAQGTEPSPLAYKAAAEISANARRLELDVETYWELLYAYYQSDAGAYTTDAYYAENGRLNYGPTSLNALFDFTRTDGSFISPPWQLKMEPLQRLVLGVTPPTTTPPAALPEITGPTLLTPESGPHRLPQLPSRLLLANVHPVSLRIDHGNLVATGPDGSTAVLQPGQTLSIGRSPDENSVGLVIKAQDVKNVSRRHATVQWDGQTALVADLSPNGTYVKPGDPLGDEFDAKLRAALQSEIPAVMDGQTVKVNLSVYTNGEAARVFREDEAIPARDLQGFEPHEITVFARSADGHTVDATIGRVRDGLGSKIQTLQSLAVGQVRPLDFSAEFGTVGAAFSRVTEDVATALAALAKPRGRADIENIVYSLGANAETLLTNQTTRRPIPYNLEYFSALINAWRNVQETVLLGGQSKFPKLSMSVPQKNLPFPIVAKDTHLVVESVANGKITLLLPSGERLTGSTIEFGRGNLGLGAVSGISAKHFTLSLVGSDVVILDNDSTNGTLVPSSTVAPRGPPAATISGLVPLIGRLYGLNPANPVDLNRIVNEKAPLVETVVTGAFYYAAVGLLSALGSAVGLHIDHAFFAATGLFALVNLAFGFSHRSVYRFKPPVPGVNRLGRWEAEPAPASRRERWGLALRGAAIHAPLLLAFMDPLGGLFLAPIAALTSVGLHAVHNRLAAERGWSALTAGGVDQKTTPPTADLVYMRANTDRRRVDLAMDGLGYTTDLHYLLAFHQGTIPEGSQPNPEETESLEREFAVAQALTQLLGYDSLAELLVANGEKKIDIRPEPVLRYPTSRELILDILTRQGVPEPARREVTSRVDAESARGVLDRLADFLGYEAVKTQTKDGEKVTPARQGLIGDLPLNLAFHRPRTDPLKVSDQRDFLPPFLKRYRLPAVAEFTLPRLGEVRKPGGKLQPFENQFTLGPRGVEKRERTDSLLTAPLLGAAWVGQGNLAVKVWLSGGVLHAQRFKHTDNQLTALDAQPIVVARALFEKGIDPTASLGLGSELFFTEKGVGLTSPDTATEGGLVALRVLAGPNDTLQIGLQYDAVNNRPTTVSGFPEAAFAAAPSLPGVLKADRGTVTAVALAAERDQKLAALAEGRKVRQALIEKSFEEAQSRENPGKWSLGLSAEDFAASYDGTDADIPAAVRAALKERVGQERDRRAAREKLWDAEAAKALAAAFQGSSLPLTAERKAGFTAKKADWTASTGRDTLRDWAGRYEQELSTLWRRGKDAMERESRAALAAALAARGESPNDAEYYETAFAAVLQKLEPGADPSETVKKAAVDFLAAHEAEQKAAREKDRQDRIAKGLKGSSDALRKALTDIGAEWLWTSWQRNDQIHAAFQDVVRQHINDPGARLDSLASRFVREQQEKSTAGKNPPAATIRGLTPLIGRLYGLNPDVPADLQRIVNEKAPIVETVLTGVLYFAGVLLISQAGPLFGLALDPSVFNAYSLFALVNLAFGAAHARVYRFVPPARGDRRLGRWELDRRPDGSPQKSSLGTRLNLAIRGLVIHSPLLLAFMDPMGGLFLAPLGAVASVALHLAHNRLAARLGWTAAAAAPSGEQGPPSNAKRLLKMSLADFLQEYAEEDFVRPGYFGYNAPAIRQRLDEWFGPNGWSIKHIVRGRVVEESEAFALYEEGYYQYFKSHPEELDRLVRMARDVYDTDPSNVASGGDYTKQGDTAARHLQDVAIRNVVKRLGRTFEGTELIQVRGRGTPGEQWAPGNIPIHDASLIRQPEMRNWWKAGSVESFFQSTKIIVLNPHPVAERLFENHRRFFGKGRLFQLKDLAALPWALDADQFPKDADGRPRAFTDNEIHQILSGWLMLMGQSGLVNRESFLHAREELRQLLAKEVVTRDQEAVDSHAAFAPYMVARLQETGQIPIFLARDALSIDEFRRYVDRLNDQTSAAAVVYHPGIFTPVGPNRRSDDKELSQIIKSIKNIMDESFREIVAEGLFPYDQLGHKSAAVRERIEEKFKEKTAALIEGDALFADYANQIYRQFRSHGLPMTRSFVVVDTYGSGKSALFVKSVIEYFAAKERGREATPFKVDVLLGWSNHVSLSQPELSDFYAVDTRDKAFLDLYWPFQYAAIHNAKSHFPMFGVKTNPTKLLSLGYQSLALYNQAVRFVRGEVPIQKAGPTTDVRRDRGPPATLPGLVPLIARLYRLNPNSPEDLNTIVTEKAPLVESALFGLFYFGAMMLMSSLDVLAAGYFGVPLSLSPTVFNQYSLFVLANLAFGALHARVYTYQDGQWRIEQNPDGSPKTASWATRLSLAVRGMGIHSPLLLTSLTPLLGPLVTILGAAATVVLHMVHNQLAAQFGWRALTVGGPAPSSSVAFRRFATAGRYATQPGEKPADTARRLADLSTTAGEILTKVDKGTAAMLIRRILDVPLSPSDLTDQFDIAYVAEGSNKVVYRVKFHASNKAVSKPLELLFAFKKPRAGEVIDRGELEALKSIGGNGTPRFGLADFIETDDGKEQIQWYVEEFVDGQTLHEIKAHGRMDSRLARQTVKTLFDIAGHWEGRIPRDSTRRNFVLKKGTDRVVMVDVGGGFYRVLGPESTDEDRAKFLFRTLRNLGMIDDRTVDREILSAIQTEAGRDFLVSVQKYIEATGDAVADVLANDKVYNEWEQSLSYWQQLNKNVKRQLDAFLSESPATPAAATIPGLVPLLAWVYGLDKNNPADVNLIVNEKAPLVESIVTGVFFYAGVGLMSALGSFFGVSIDHSFFAATGLFALVNVAFGFSHRSVYRFAPAEPGTRGLGRWELESAPASRQTRWNLALRGMAIHAPLLLAFMDPFGGLFLAPLGALAGVVLHAVHNRAAARFGWTALTAGHAPTAGPAAPKYIDAEGKAVLARAGAKLRASVEKLRRGGRLTEDDHVTGMFICSNNESRSAISEILARKALFNFNSSLVPAAERDQFQSSINAILPRLEVTSPEGTVTTLTMRSGMKLDFPEGTQYKEVLPEAPDPEALKTIRFFSAGLGANGFGRTRHYRAEALKANVSAVPPEVYVPPATTKFDENTLRARKPDFLIAFVDTKALRPDGRPAATALAVLKAQAKKLGFEDKLVIVEMPDEEPDTLWPKLTRFIQTEVLTGLGFSATKPAAAAPAHGPTRGAVGWWAPVANRLLDRFPSLANSRNLSFALFGALESVLLLAVNFLLPFTGYAEGSDVLNDATLGVALFGAHYVSGILNFNPETKRFEPAPGTFGRALGATAIASTTFVPLMMLDLFMTGGVSHWMTAAAGAAGVAAHALLNVRDSIVRWMGDRTRSVKTLATAALLSLNLLSVPLALSQTNVETPALPLATLERAQVARLNMSQLAPGEASIKRAEQWMAKDNPLLQASAQLQRIKLEGANTPDDLKILTWLLEVTHTWKLDTSKVSAVVLTSNLPAPGMFNDLKKKGESDAEAKRVVYLDRNNTALGLLATWAHEAGHITRDNRQVAEADTLGEDSRIAASLLPYVNDAAKDWPGVRDRFGLPADLAFYNPQAMGVLGGTNLSARDAFWLRYDVVPAVAAFLLREAPTPALLSPNHSAVKAEINRLVPLVSQRVFRVQAVYGLSTYSIGITNGRVTITFMDARNRAFPIDLGIPAAPKTPEPGLPAGTGSTQGPNGRRLPGTGEEDFNAWARLALMETLLGSKAEPFEFTIPTPVGSGDYWTARNFNELRSEYTSVDDATRLGGFESFLQLLSNDRTGARRWINEPARREQLAEGALLAAGARAAQDSATTLHVNLFGYKGWSAREQKDMRIFLTGLAGAVRPGTNLVVAAEGANPLADVFAEAIKTGAAAVHVLTPARVPGLADAEGRVVMSEVVAWINRPENQKSGMMKGTRIIARDANSVTKAEGFLIIGLQKLSEAIANDIATMLKIMTQA